MECSALGAAVVDHSCFHTTFGPFKSVQATSGTVPSAGTPEISAVHTEYRVALAGNISVVSYVPERSGTWAFFLGSPVPLRLLDANGAALKETFAAKGDVGCDGLVEVHAFELRAGERYNVVFGETNVRSVIVVVEYVNDFIVENGRDVDGDGYGTPNDVLRTPCVPPKGYVQNTSDCDDADPARNPGAAELCGDSIDQNCNGLVDDEGLQCRVGKGACERVGVRTCQGPVGSQVSCNAVAGEPSAELCNGLDDNCDGVIDEQADLCVASTEGPTCVRDGFRAFCGCTLDLDCGVADSGRVCDVSRRNCVDGCSTVAGRNGCPTGSTCLQGAAAQGTCAPAGLDAPHTGVADAGASGTTSPSEASARGCGCRVGRGGHSKLTNAGFLLVSVLWAMRRRRTRAHCGARAHGAQGLSPGYRGKPLKLVVAASTTLLVGCGGRASFEDSIAAMPAGDSCRAVLAEDVVAHACSHFARDSDIPVAATKAALSDVSTLHKTFSILVVEPGAAVGYRPRRSGDHVFLTDKVVDIDVVGVPPPPGATAIALSGCVHSVQARAASLIADGQYTVKINAPANTSFRLFIEFLPAFGADAWAVYCSP